MKKAKKCKICGTEFSPFKTTQQVCSIPCAIKHASNVNQKKERKATREAKAKIKKLTDYLNETQVVFNKYIRERDKHLPCISCGTTANIQFCAGHFRTRKAASHLRFNEDNVHKQCNQHCNLKLSGNLLNYREGLIKKIGLDRVEALMNDNSKKRWTKEEALEIKRIYKEKLKEIENGKA